MMHSPEFREDLSQPDKNKDTPTYLPAKKLNTEESDRRDSQEADALLIGLDEERSGNVYEDFKDFNFDSILTFNNGVKFKDNIVKSDEKGRYIELKGIKFYDLNEKLDQNQLPENGHIFSISKNLLYLGEFKNGKYTGKGLQINKNKDITSVIM